MSIIQFATMVGHFVYVILTLQTFIYIWHDHLVFHCSRYMHGSASTNAQGEVQSSAVCVVCHNPLTLYCLNCHLPRTKQLSSQIPPQQPPSSQRTPQTSAKRKPSSLSPFEKASSHGVRSRGSRLALSPDQTPSSRTFPSGEAGQSHRFPVDIKPEPVAGTDMDVTEKSGDPFTEEREIESSDGPVGSVEGESDIESVANFAADPESSEQCAVEMPSHQSQGADSSSKTHATVEKLVGGSLLVLQPDNVYAIERTDDSTPNAKTEQSASPQPQQSSVTGRKTTSLRRSEKHTPSKGKRKGKNAGPISDAEQPSASAASGKNPFVQMLMHRDAVEY